MGKRRAPYPAQFRQQIVELVGAGRTPAELAREASYGPAAAPWTNLHRRSCRLEN
jgi:transposase